MRCIVVHLLVLKMGLRNTRRVMTAKMRTDSVALQREEQKATQVIKQAAKKGQTQGCRDIAAAIASSRKLCRHLQTVKFRLDSLEINLQQQRCKTMFCDKREKTETFLSLQNY